MGAHFKEISGTRVEPGDEAGTKLAPSRKAELIAETREFWQRRAARPLHDEDARQIVENVTGFFDLLHQWDREARDKAGE